MTPNTTPRSRYFVVYNVFMTTVIFIVSLLVFGFRINQFPLHNWDEAWYAGVRPWLLPFWNGQYFLDKPPLYFWLSAPFIWAFPNQTWTFRIVSVLSASLLCLLIYAYARRRQTQLASLAAVIIFISTHQVIERFSKGNLDALLALLLFAFYFSYTSHRFVLSGVLLGLAWLTKGWLISLLPLTLICLESPSRLLKPLCLAAAIFLSWLILASIATHQPVFSWYVFSPAAGNLESPFANLTLTFLFDFFRDLGFWWMLFIPALIASSRQKTFSLLVTTVIFILGLSLLRQHLGWYLLPLYPFLALYLSTAFSKIRRRSIIITLAVLLTFQLVYLNHLSLSSTDNSPEGASLGLWLSTQIPKDVVLYTDYHDFPTLLFYSGLDRIRIIKANPLPFEYWTVTATPPYGQHYLLLPSTKPVDSTCHTVSSYSSFSLYSCK